MLDVIQGSKVDVIFWVSRKVGTGAVVLTSPLRRILNASKAVVAGFDWAAASWDAENALLYASFDAGQVGLSTAGTYYVDLRGTVGDEIVTARATLRVIV